MKYLEEKTSNVSILVENQFPDFVQETNSKFLNFVSSYYESLENKYQPLDVVSNLVDYYNIGYYRYDKLVKSTKLVSPSNLDETTDTITVSSTVGFPDKNGYLQIDDEIIFYKSKTKTQFLECVRGTSALILERLPKSTITLKSSVAAEHKNNSDVENIAFNFTNEFLTRIKSELAPQIPEVLDESLDIANFIKNIKSFYSAKGSLNSHRILFKILFNDRKFSIKLKPRGTGAKIKINNSFGQLRSDGIIITSGGSGYDGRTDLSGNFINSPYIDIIGNGFGEVDGVTSLRKNQGAVLEVSGISNGVITSVTIKDPGEEGSYKGSIEARVRPRSFKEDQIVKNISGTGSGRVEYYDPKSDEIILYDVVGYFLPNDEIFTDTLEKARGFISQSYVSPTTSRNGLEVLGETQNIEFPKNYTFKTSDSRSSSKKIIKCKLLDGYELPNDFLPKVASFKQDADNIFGVNGVTIEVDSNTVLSNNTFALDVTTNTDLNRLFLPPSTVVTKNLTSDITESSTDFVITVDEASRFPVTNGIVHINGKEVLYKTRSVNQLLGCSYLTDIGNTTQTKESFSVKEKDEVISLARLKYNVEWQTNTVYRVGDRVFYGENAYVAKNTGTSGTTPPTHTIGLSYDGTIVSSNPVQWEYLFKNRLDHTLYVDKSFFETQPSLSPRFQLLGLPSEAIIEEGGALNTKESYEFARFDSPNVQAYDFTSREISDRLSVVLGTNFNWNRESVIEEQTDNQQTTTNIKSLKSYESLIGFNAQYDFEDYIYVAGSGIPRWWKDIVDFNSTLSDNDKKKVAFTNQKLLTRWKKSGLISDTQAIGVGRKTKKLLGLNIDAIQVNSCKGNTILNGYIDKFFIGNNGGDYPVIYSSNGLSADLTKLPKFNIDGVNENNQDHNFIKISSSLKSINFAKLAIAWQNNTNLKGFTSKPTVTVINNNPFKRITFTSFSNLNTTTGVITFTNHNFEDGLKVTYNSSVDYFTNLQDGDVVFVRKIDNNSFTIHKTKSDSLLKSNPIKLIFKDVSNPSYSLTSDQLNPPYFKESKLDVSFKNGVIDNIIILESGAGYVELPTIRISGGGKYGVSVDIPYAIGVDRILDFSGPLISYYNYYKENYNELTVRELNSDNTVKTPGFTEIETSYDTTPTILINNGVDAKAVAYTSNGSVVAVSVLNEGKDYTVPPIVKVLGEGKDAVIESIVNGGKVTGFKIINGGTGYVTSPKLEIVPFEYKKATISARLKEWTFNLVRKLNELGRIDSYGGYVYDDGDATPTANNSKKFKIIDYDNDFPKDFNRSQYYIIQNSDKLLAKYIKEKFNLPAGTTDATALTTPIHSPAITISYDGIPIYGGNKILGERNKSLITDITDSNYSSQFVEAKSRYKLKYTTQSTGDSNEITTSINGTTYYLSRVGGPSITDYPIGTFVEDYEFIEGDDNDLDKHNGRFSITPEFPTGRYCYFTTRQSFDAVTNAIVENSGIDFGGYPYFIGDEFASDYDDYMNNRCRTNDRIPSAFTRSFEKNIDPIPNLFAGLDHNDEYPKELTNTAKTIASTTTISPGSVDSLIIESKGDGYRVGDRLVVDNNRTSGGGFDAIVSKVGGKKINNIVISDDGLESTFITAQPHGLSINDFVYFDYIQPNYQLEVDLHNNYLGNATDVKRISDIQDFTLDLASNENIDTYSNIKFHKINLNFKYTYKLNLPANTDFKLTYDIQQTNEFFTLEESPANTVVLNANKIPNRLYLHTGDRIYEINKTKDYYGIQKVTKITTNSFSIKLAESGKGYEVTNISYTAKSFGATGPIEDISITNGGNGYKKLPKVTKIVKKGSQDDIAGNGKAIIQTNSNSIGKLKKVTYNSIGNSFTANRNVNYYLNVPATAKILNNFEIYDIEIVSGGENYPNAVTLLVNGSESGVKIETEVYLGTIISARVIDGGLNFSEEPTITVKPDPDVSVQGSGAVFKAKIRRKKLFPGTKISGVVNSSLFPVPIQATIVTFDENSSTLEFDENVGQFKDNDKIYIGDRVYGTITSIRRSKVYAKVSPTAEINVTTNDITGRTSEYLQKLTDSNYYQDWSYSISSSRDTIEWKPQQDLNTHPAGFKQFGKKTIERRKFFFKNPLDVLKSNFTFTTSIVGKLNANVNLSPCGKQRLFLPDVSGFSIDTYIVGTQSNANGRIIEKTESSLIIEQYGDVSFEPGEVIVTVDQEFVKGTFTSTNRVFNFWNGIFQEPGVSYDASGSNPITYVPRYTVGDTDKIIIYTSDINSEYTRLDTQILLSGQTSISFRLDNKPYPISSGDLDNLIISIAGVVQNPTSLLITENSVVLGSSSSVDSRVFAIKHPNLTKLTFSSATNSNTHTISSGQTITDDCQLFIFRDGVLQSQLVSNFTRSGNTITLSGGETIDSAELFGWHFNGTIDCSLTDGSSINENTLVKIIPCKKSFFRQFIESNAAKRPESIYELRKENISGTVIPSNTHRVEGFDTKFTYTSPALSESYVDVLDPIIFTGLTSVYTLTKFGETYSPSVNDVIVSLNNSILINDIDYQISSSTITFLSGVPAVNDKCVIIEFNSSHQNNILDNIEVTFDGSRKTFNLSHDGIPKYVNNISDIFAIKNGQLQIPTNSYLDHRNETLSSHTVNDNKITFVTAPLSSDTVDLVYFNRQLLPEPTKNVILDKPLCFDGVLNSFPITILGVLTSPVNVNNIFVVRNGVVQNPSTDYSILNNNNITFSTVPTAGENIDVFYSYDGLNQNIFLDNLTGIDGTTTIHNLTSGGNAFTPPSTDDLLVVRNGVVQNSSEDYTVSGSTITFTSALQTTESIFIIYTHGAEEVTISSSSAYDSTTFQYNLSSPIPAGDEDHYVVYADGVPNLYNKAFTVHNGGSAIRLGHHVNYPPLNVFIMKYTSVDTVDDIVDCPNGSRTRFRLLLNNTNLVPSNIVEDADILISVNGVVLEPGVQYNLPTSRAYVDLSFAPAEDDVFFMIRMNGNLKKTLTSAGGNLYNLSDNYTTNDDKEDLVVFSNNTWKFWGDGFEFTDSNTIQLTEAHTTGNLFAIKFFGGFYKLDDVSTPFNGSRTKFNLFDSEENFVPVGTIDNDDNGDASSIFITKNGKLLESGYDYILTGGMNSQINFTNAPVDTDTISVSTYGSFDKLDTIANGSGTVFPLTKSSAEYYPNAHIERPRKHDNQIIVTKDGDLQSPLHDYYVDNNSIVFLSPVTGSRLAFRDFRGLPNDVKVYNRNNQVSVGDEIMIPGEEFTRYVTEVKSPSVMTARQLIPSGKFISGNTYIVHEVKKNSDGVEIGNTFIASGTTQNHVVSAFTSTSSSIQGNTPTGFTSTTSFSDGFVTNLTVTDGGEYYENPVIIRTKGPGTSIKATARINNYLNNGTVDSNSIDLVYPGQNVYANQQAIATSYASVHKKLPLHKAQIRKSTNLQSSINSTIETLSLGNVSGLPSNTPTVSVNSSSGSGAEFKVYISNGELRKLVIVSGGSGYDDRDITVELTGGGGSGCVLEPTLDASGTITDIIIRNPGTGYDTFRVIAFDRTNNTREVIEYTYVDSITNQISGCTRGVGGTSAVSHVSTIENPDDPTTGTLVYFDSYL